MSQEGRMEGWYDLKVPVDHTEWFLDMSSRYEGNFYEVFQVDLQDQVHNRSKYQKIQSKVCGFYQKERVDYGKKLL